MKTINKQALHKLFKSSDGENMMAVYVSPYFQYEEWYAKHIFLSVDVDEPTHVTHYGQTVDLVLPLDRNTVNDGVATADTITPYLKELVDYLGVHAPVISLFDLSKKKLAQIDTGY